MMMSRTTLVVAKIGNTLYGDTMTPQQLIDYCLTKKGAYLDFPFNDWYPVIKIRMSNGNGKIFAEIFNLKGEDKFTFGTDSGMADFLRENYPNVIVRGWHCPPVQAKYKSTVTLHALSDEEIIKLADISYNRTLSKLPKKERDRIANKQSQ